jgi:hypothetical protein
MTIKGNKTDEAWEKLFIKYNILKKVDQEGIFKISATQINEYREARLMTKFDHSINLPKLFKQSKLSILPDSRGTYVIGKFKAYHELKYYDLKPIPKTIPDHIQTFDNFSITSESTALNIAYMTGMIDDVLMTKQRMSSGIIDYSVKMEKNNFYDFNVSNSQIEIDGSYEGLNKIAVVEAKNKIPLDFHIRQLYYPYRFYKNLRTNKEILPVFFTLADDIFSFHIFKFENTNEYSSIKKVDQVNFILHDALNLNLDEVKKISFDSLELDEPSNVPFPQADNFSRILDMIDYLTVPRNKFELAESYTFDVRQSDYYANALVYLGIAQKNEEGKFQLTKLGFNLKEMHNSNKRNRILIELMLKQKSFKLSFDSVLKNSGEFDKKYISKVLLENVPTIKKKSTADRRTSTVCSWINWVFSVID